MYSYKSELPDYKIFLFLFNPPPPPPEFSGGDASVPRSSALKGLRRVSLTTCIPNTLYEKCIYWLGQIKTFLILILLILSEKPSISELNCTAKPKFKHTTTLVSVYDNYILSRSWRVIVDLVQTNYHGRHQGRHMVL